MLVVLSFSKSCHDFRFHYCYTYRLYLKNCYFIKQKKFKTVSSGFKIDKAEHVSVKATNFEPQNLKIDENYGIS